MDEEKEEEENYYEYDKELEKSYQKCHEEIKEHIDELCNLCIQQLIIIIVLYGIILFFVAMYLYS